VAIASLLKPIPPLSYHAGSTSKWLFTIWAGGFAILVLPYCLYRLGRYRDLVPFLVWLGGFVISVGEPMLDHMGHMWWPTNLPGPAFKGWGLHIPLLNPFCYVFFIAMTGYFAYRLFLRGISMSQLFGLWAVFGLVDMVLELPGTSVHVYDYYAPQPLDIGGFPMHWAWLNASGMIGVGFLLYLVVPRLHGWWQSLIVLLPTYGFLGAYGLVAWPAFLALNWNMSRTATVFVDLVSLLLAVLMVRGVGEVVCRKPEAAAEPPATTAASVPDHALA
jgi:hypothetical protein